MGGWGFNPRARTGRDEFSCAYRYKPDMFQSTRPIRGATQTQLGPLGKPAVSIHAPRMGRDLGTFRNNAEFLGFNPRAPYGARPRHASGNWSRSEFQSTRPVWGATLIRRRCYREAIVSIHAPRMGRDTKRHQVPCRLWCFNPRAPYGARRLQHNMPAFSRLGETFRELRRSDHLLVATVDPRLRAVSGGG